MINACVIWVIYWVIGNVLGGFVDILLHALMSIGFKDFFWSITTKDDKNLINVVCVCVSTDENRPFWILVIFLLGFGLQIKVVRCSCTSYSNAKFFSS